MALTTGVPIGLRNRGVHGVDRGVFTPLPAAFAIRGDRGTAGDAYEEEGRVVPPVGVCEEDGGFWTWSAAACAAGVSNIWPGIDEEPIREFDWCVGEWDGGVKGGVLRLGDAGMETSSLSVVMPASVSGW